jgi:hypothetical protein
MTRKRRPSRPTEDVHRGSRSGQPCVARPLSATISSVNIEALSFPPALPLLVDRYANNIEERTAKTAAKL